MQQLRNIDAAQSSLRERIVRAIEGEEVTRKDREQMVNICRWAAVEKDPVKFEELACELNDLVEPL